MKTKTRFLNFQNFGLIIILLLLLILFWSINRKFLNFENIKNILLSISVIGIIAVPMTLLMIGGGVDLSVGALMGFSSSLVAAFITKLGFNPIIAVILTLMAGAAVGLVNGVVVTKIKVNAFIATIGMLSILQGSALVMTSNKGQIATFSGSIGIENKSFSLIGLGEIFKIPIQVIIFIIFFIIGYVILNHTQFGRKAYASGASEKVAILSGINVDRTRIISFMFTSFAAAAGGIILASQFLAGAERIGTGYELLVITAVILGGTAFTGGIGTMQGVLLGVVIMGVLRYGMDLQGVGDYYKQLSNGALLLIAVGVGVLRDRLLGFRTRV
ncbi:MAG: ABC transporter permease [Actinobacteria bacterium]|nr:ABC transporter permease [Actinomycetota bacterium]